MIPKWKTILTNWMNCYSSESEIREQNITPAKLFNIFTHIQESIRLDDSNSSKFKANTIQDFIFEKYPEFKFENGSLEATCEEEVYIVASLLLFFICVNSKNAEIKRVMCSKLSGGDQETIMKFSKCLMDCSPILYADVEAAIAEACVQDPSGKVSETPPALRSLHNEVRRLQAALDAERFDRNYLQEELARTNLKLEKLTKVKEQYKLDNLNLKAKISLCCDDHRESYREARADEFIARLQRQLQELEGRLEDTLGLLDDVQQERDTYKIKVCDLREERDKWLSLSQEEADKAGQLADQLDIERRSVASLRELVSELRQHNRNNGMDSSMLECDDPDMSIQSMSNLSVCTEVCANVIEVQLGEERAKIESLKQEIQSLQEQLFKVNQNFESEKLSLEATITEKENNLLILKQHVNKEIEDKTNLKRQYDQEISKRNKIIDDITQKIKDVEENTNQVLEEKEQEIRCLRQMFADETERSSNEITILRMKIKEQNDLKTHCDKVIIELNNKILQITHTINEVEQSSKCLLEEKEQEVQSLLRKLADETKNSGTTIENLQKEIENEVKLKQQYEQENFKLKQKVVETSQQVKDVEKKFLHVLKEKTQEIQLLKQQSTEEIEKSSVVMKNLQKEIEEQCTLKSNCEQEIDKLNNKIIEMSLTAKVAEDHSKHTIEEKVHEIQMLQHKLAEETKKLETMTDNFQKEIKEQNNLKNQYEQENMKLINRIAEMSQEIEHSEKKSKLLDEKVQEIQSLKLQYAGETEKSDMIIKHLQVSIQEQINLKEHCEHEIVILNDKIVEMSQKIRDAEEHSKHVLEEKAQEIQSLQDRLSEETRKSNTMIENLQKEIEKEGNLKKHCAQEIVILNNKIDEMSQTIKYIEQNSKRVVEEKVQEIQSLQQQIANETEESGNVIKNLQKEFEECNSLKKHYEQDTVKLNDRISEMLQTINNVEVCSKIALEEKEQQIQLIQKQFAEELKEIEIKNEILQETIKDTKESSKLALEEKVKENYTLQQQFAEESEKSVNFIENLYKQLEAEKHNQLMLKEELENLIAKLNDKVSNLNSEVVDLNKKLIEKSQIIDVLQSDLKKEKELRDELSTKFNHQLLQLNEQKTAVEIESAELKRQLQEKETHIDKLEKEVKNLTIYRSNLEEKCQNLMDKKQKEIESLDEEVDKLNNTLGEMSQTIINLKGTSKLELEEKLQEIQALHEQFQAESVKSENIIKNLKIELEAEKYAQLKLKEEFDNRIMKLNEKVLNRNNELVELQNNIIQKSELIEVLQSDLRREKELRHELSNTCNHQLFSLNEQKNTVETNMQQKLHEISEQEKQLEEKEIFINKLNIEVENLRASTLSLEEKCRHREGIITQKQKEIEFINDIFQNEQEKLAHKIDERNASIKSLQMQLQNEIEYKIQLQRELSEFQKCKLSLIEEVNAAKNLIKEHEENALVWEKEKKEMLEQIQASIRKVEKLGEEKAILLEELKALKDVHSSEAKAFDEKIEANILKVEKLEDDKALLLKEIELLKAVQGRETKEYEENMLMWKKQKSEMAEQIQANFLKIKELEDEKALLFKDMEAFKDAQIKEIKDHEAKAHMWEKQKVEVKEEIKAIALMIKKLEDEKTMLLKEMEALKAINKEETKNYEEKTLMWEKEKNEMKEQIQANDIQIKKLEDEKTILLKEMDTLKAMNKNETKNYEEKTLMWEKEKNEMTEQIQANTLKIKKLEDEKELLLKDLEVLKAAQIEETKDHEAKAQMWEKQKLEINDDIKDRALMMKELDDEKKMLLKEMETLKAINKKETKNFEEKTLMLEKERNEMKEQIKANVIEIKKVEDEKAILLKEMEVLKAAQIEDSKDHEAKAYMWEKQNVEIKEEIKARALMMKELEDEKTMLMKEMETLKAINEQETKNYEEKTLMWEKEKNEMKEQIQANVIEIKKLEDEKAVLLKEMEVLKADLSGVTNDLEEKDVMCEKQKLEINQKMQFNILKVEKLEQEKALLLNEMEHVKAAHTSETKDREETIVVMEKLEDEKTMLMKEIEELKGTQIVETNHQETCKRDVWETQTNEVKAVIQAHVIKLKNLEEEKAMLLKEIESLKSQEREKSKDYDEKTLMWEKQKTEMNEEIRTKVLKIKELQNENAMMLKNIKALNEAQVEINFNKDYEEKVLTLEKQKTELEEQKQANVFKLEKLEKEKVVLLKELEALKAAQKETLAVATQDKITESKHTSWDKEIHGIHHQVDTSTSDLTHSSMDSLKTISDLEKIIQDKNRKITTMQTEITYIKSIMAESGIKLIDVTKELEVSKDTCQELSSQLKKIVQQKNEEIAELRRQVAKMSATENRASQIIKVSAKYQAMILKRIAEIKSNAVLKELTNFGNQNSNGDGEVRRTIAGSVTMEDLENFLETTDRHLKRCSEKQIALQKDRDRLTEVNRINESEIINMKKFLTEMSVSFRTFTTVKEVYNQKLSKIVSLQRTVRRDILSLDGRITEATMCKLERGYAAVMQDLSECAMNLERWVDRSVSRMLSVEKIKQAFTSDLEQASLSTCNYQNAAVEVQLSELENSFQKLLAEIGRAQKGEGARSTQEITIMEVRAEYEDKLNRMKAKMKELFNEEMGRLKQKQADEIAILERELGKTRERMLESSQAYEQHIRALTTELWSVGEKFLVKQEEADWLRRKQSGSLMSLQHVHSSGLHPPLETIGRPSDTHSLRSLPVHNKKSEARGLHMSDEEGEVFDNRFLKELSATPRASLSTGQRLSELKRRNSLVPAHLKSSYPAETQFAPTLDEEDIKCVSTSFSLGRPQRKEVGITAYKKPGPPTPSKQAGRLSATDSELRESLRAELDPSGRKTSTPSRIRSLFRPSKNDLDVGTPRRRFSNIFRKK